MSTNLHEIEEAEFGRGPRLWDADPDVCCAAFQLGACVHTEADLDYGFEELLDTFEATLDALVAVDSSEEPF
jgi:hypothetical protein